MSLFVAQEDELATMAEAAIREQFAWLVKAMDVRQL
jgi:hypothetical protein